MKKKCIDLVLLQSILLEYMVEAGMNYTNITLHAKHLTMAAITSIAHSIKNILKKRASIYFIHINNVGRVSFQANIWKLLSLSESHYQPWMLSNTFIASKVYTFIGNANH